jgi:ABC-type transport system involved in cytochrome c biogenesis permease subunit
MGTGLRVVDVVPGDEPRNAVVAPVAIAPEKSRINRARRISLPDLLVVVGFVGLCLTAIPAIMVPVERLAAAWLPAHDITLVVLVTVSSGLGTLFCVSAFLKARAVRSLSESERVRWRGEGFRN